MTVATPPAFKGPACLPAGHLSTRLNGRRVSVAGLVILRQRPGTAKGVIFLTLEDETGIVNVIVWRALYERFRRAVIAGRCLRVTGRLQCESGVMHLIAERIEDISPLLDTLLAPEFDTNSGPNSDAGIARAGGNRPPPPENAAPRQPVASHGTGGNAALPQTGQTG